MAHWRRGLEMIFGMRQFAQLAFVPLCCTGKATSCQRPQCHFLFATLQISMTKNYRMRSGKKSVPDRTFRPRFVCLPTNDPFKSTSIMVIHNGLVYWDPWACWLPCPGSLSPSLHHHSSQHFSPSYQVVWQSNRPKGFRSKNG